MAGIPQVITSDRASGAQVIDGSLKFDDGSSQYLNRTPSSAGNKTVWTSSFWIKLNKVDGQRQIFTVYTDSSNDSLIKINSNGYLEIWNYRSGAYKTQYISNARFRDHSAWYNFVISCNGSTSLSAWVNGVAITFSTSTGPDGTDWLFNGTNNHQIGRYNTTANSDFQLSQVNWIDGQALGPEYFGFTDGLTNTWKPKKYTGDFNIAAESYSTDIGVFTRYNTTPNADSTVAYLNSNPDSSSYPLIQSSQSSNNTITVKFASAQNGVTSIKFRGGGYSSSSTYTLFVNGTQVGGTHNTNTLWAEDSHTISSTNITELEIVGSDGFALGQLKFGDSLVSGTVSYGTEATGVNSFYLPFDGSAPIGQDQSGQGNNYTPVNFGGSVALDNPQVSGARPILNTTQGGTQAGVGVFGSKQNVGYAVTVYNDGGGNKYYIDGVKQDTVTGLIRGATYTFDTSDSTVSSHPFRFSATSNGSHGGGSEYTNGVAAITGAATTITVPHDAPNTLYYYCTSHSGMGADITGITTNEKLADQYASHCVLAMPLVGVSTDVSASIACTSTTKIITSNGDPAASTSDSNFYGGSYEFDGTDDCLTSSDCGSGATEYTMECWFNTDGFSQNQRPINMSQDLNGNRYLYAEVRTDKKIQIREESTGSAVSADAVFESNKWHHVAVSYDGVRLRGFVDGVFVVQTSANGSPVALGNNMKMRVGADESNTSSNEFDGHIQDVRVYFGACKYTATNIGDQAFIVPATSPDILPDTPSGVSGGSKLTKIADGAVAFDGTGDDLHIADSDDFEFGTGDFTIECFAYHTVDSDDHLISKYGSSNANRSWRLVSDGNQKIIFYWYYSTDSSLNITSAAGKFSLNRWHHIVAQRTSGDIYLFVDGELVGSNTSSGAASEFNNNSTAVAIAGDLNGSSQDFPGFISNVRIVKGTGVYSTLGFTPPTAPLTNVTNTKLLCCQSVAEQQNNFIRMFLSDTLYTTKADILANATEVDDGESGISNKYWYIVPTGTEPIGSDVFTNDGSVTTPHASNHFALLWRNGSSWTKTIGTYGPSEYSDFDYKSDDDTSTYSVYPARDFYVFGVDDGSPAPELISGTLPTRAKYYKFDGAVKPGAITANGDASASNFNPFNTDINAVRGQETGYATLNPLHRNPNGNTTSNGNLTQSTSAGNGHYRANFAIGASSGKFYFEYEPTGGAVSGMVGLCEQGHGESSNLNGAKAYSYYGVTGYKQGSPSAVDSAYGATYTFGDVIGVAFDSDNNTLEFFKNGVSQGVAFTSFPNYPYYPAFSAGSSTNTVTYNVNFGQNPFKFPPPDGFQPLNAANVRPETVISRPDQYVGVTTYTGNNTVGRIIDIGRNADLVWVKKRTAENHILVDTVRGEKITS